MEMISETVLMLSKVILTFLSHRLTNEQNMRLDKYIGKSTQLTTAQVLEVIARGEVSVNGVLIDEPAFQVHENNVVYWLDTYLERRPFRYIMLNKPPNMVCSNIDEHYPCVFNLLDVSHQHELHIAGRLDADTTGLVLITDDGSWSYRLTYPDNHCPKVYRVSLSKPITNEMIKRLKGGISLQGKCKPTLPAQIEVVNSYEVLLTITEGKFHQVKRMFAAVGNRVNALHREAIGEINLDVQEGQWRYI